MESQLGPIDQSFNSRYSCHVREALDELPDNFIITDPSLPGHPIVFASLGFLKMSGYSKHEVIGKNGRIFQGPGTCRRSVIEIREAIREERGIQINLLNYRKDGRPFWMLFHMSPVFNKHDGRVSHFVAVQVPITRKRRSSGCGFERNEVNLSEDGSKEQDFVYGSCRKEVCLGSLLELGRVLSLHQVLEHDVRESDSEEPCEASEVEKRKATTAMDNIFSVLTHYSESTGRLVCRKRCSISGVGLLSSSLIISLGRIKQSFVLTDPRLPDMPIVYASDAFLKLTGYVRDEVLGRNCRFLSGLNTDTSTLYSIRESIKFERPCTVRILNYRKDESSFWNLLHISPVRDASGKIAYFVGVQIEEGCVNKHEGQGLSPDMRQLGVVGAVKVAVRGSLLIGGSSK
ncbi:putative LOV domain-containing protein [Senna tora]|uniref:Putative LOV domain-containing protein n=1 Tax=Senna tora TaxID=362788 RepID=A0A834STZ8_9FABA|nr:putative LOV domain-containing protein [Senna tora]